ncbi:MAG: TRAP transporter substrate-binding protein [Desulfotignum sp.]|nr:TRAP transporter substrate-binding protein [Desulfotignum sp.]MCF8126501.1 TRAP transporter substrate-binding protein [Desulfotignum sp.]
MKKVCLVMIMVLAMSATALAAKPFTIKLGVVTKPGAAQNIVAQKFKELVEARSDGAYMVKIYHSASIGNETEILQQIQMGTIHMGVITGGPFDTFDPIVRVINYPFLFKDHAQADRILDGPLGEEILESLATYGFKGLCFSENGFRNLTNNKRAVTGPDDVKGLKIRVMSSALHKAIWQALGANPTPMPWPIYTELEQGVIDGQENPLWVMEVYKFYEIQKHMTLTRHVYSPHINVAGLNWFNSLPAEDQALIKDAVREAARFQRKDNRKKNAGRLAMLKEQGMQVVENPDIAAFRERVAGLKQMDLYQEPRVQDLLSRMLEAVQ